jgi:hypothetical protein
MRVPATVQGHQPHLWVDYRKRVQDLKIQRSENPYNFIKFVGVEERFWSQFHQDYYHSVLF